MTAPARSQEEFAEFAAKNLPQFAVTREVRVVDTLTVAVRHPLTDAPLGIEIDFFGRYTAEFKEAGRALSTKKGEESEWGLDALVAFTKGWRGVKDTDGRDIAATPANVRAFYSAPALGWLLDQLREEFFDKTRFFEPANAR